MQIQIQTLRGVCIPVGTVLKANEQHIWEVLFDFNGKVKVCSLKSLSIVPLGSGVHLHEEI